MDHDRARILVVDDDEQLTALLSVVLEGEGYQVVIARDGATALTHVQGGEFRLVVLDIDLGQDDGRVVLSDIRKLGNFPVIFISGHADPAERILGLRMGADDFLAKPFSPMELAARVASVLRRTQAAGTLEQAASTAPSDGLVIDERTRDVLVGGVKAELTAKEFDLLAFLARSPRQVFSRSQLLQQVWASQPGWQDEATVTEHVRRIRHKVEPDPEKPRWVTTVRGVGYRFEP